MSYSIRDLLGHFIKPRAKQGAMCPHPCCRGKRPHPGRFPLMLPRGMLREMSDAELERHFQKPSVRDSGDATSQVIGELDRREEQRSRREEAARRKAGRAQAAKGARASARSQADTEYRGWLEHQWTSAEAATRGNMLNRRGQRALGGTLDPRALWTMGDRDRERYASEELRAWWDRHPVLTRKDFAGGQAAAGAARQRRSSRLYGVY
jgi:hypothetical protein